MAKRILVLLLVLCMCCAIPALDAAAAGSGDVSTLEGFLNRVVNIGGLYDYDCEKVGEPQGQEWERNSYDAMVMGLFGSPCYLDLNAYGINISYGVFDQYDGISQIEANWVFKNILNWSDATWEGLQAYAAKNDGYFYQDCCCLKDGWLCGTNAGRGSMAQGVEIRNLRTAGTHLEVVFDTLYLVFSGEGQTTERETCYAEVERKTIDGNSYWTVYRTRKLGEGEDPLSPEGAETPGDKLTWLMEAGMFRGVRMDPTYGGAWAGAYADFLRNVTEFDQGGSKEDALFQLLYLDGDMVPELAVGTDELAISGLSLYTYRDGQVIPLGCYGAMASFRYVPRENLFLYGGGRQGAYYTVIKRIENGEVVETAMLNEVHPYDDLDGEVTYSIDGRPVSESEYQAELDEYIQGKVLYEASYKDGFPIDTDALRALENDFRSLIVSKPFGQAS